MQLSCDNSTGFHLVAIEPYGEPFVPRLGEEQRNGATKEANRCRGSRMPTGSQAQRSLAVQLTDASHRPDVHPHHVRLIESHRTRSADVAMLALPRRRVKFAEGLLRLKTLCTLGGACTPDTAWMLLTLARRAVEGAWSFTPCAFPKARRSLCAGRVHAAVLVVTTVN